MFWTMDLPWKERGPRTLMLSVPGVFINGKIM